MRRLLTRYDMTNRQGAATGVLLLLTAIVYLYDLGINKWANAYYAAAAQSGSQNWKAFFYGSFNPTNSITVDKPPLSLWFMDLSVRIFGLNTYGLLIPQALMGVATVLLLTMTVKRYFGFTPGLVAGYALLITPVAALMFRFNNPDALLTLLTMVTIWATLRLNERGRLGWALLLGATIGLAFMTKTFQGLLPLPALFIAFMFFGQPRVWRRLVAVAVTAVTMILVGGLWFFIVSLIPAADRPYIGGSLVNSVTDLAFGYNGLSRITGASVSSAALKQLSSAPPSITRLLVGSPGASIGWFLPLALLTGVVAVILFFKTRRTSPRFFFVALVFLTVLSSGLVFSFMNGIFHSYYTAQMAPLLASLVGVFWWLWQQTPNNYRLRLTVAGIIICSGIYEGFVPILNNDGSDTIVYVVFALSILSAILVALPTHLTHPYARYLSFALVVALGAGPAFYTFSTVTISQMGSDVHAGPYTSNKVPSLAELTGTSTTTNSSHNEALLIALANLANVPQVSPVTVATILQHSNHYEYPVSAVGGQNAAAYQLETNTPVLLIGGFNGTDPYPSFNQFKMMVKSGKIHYFALSSGGQIHNAGGTITLWIMDNFPGKLVGNVKLYDLTQPTAGAFN